jgi:hypothetical protein
MLGRLMRRVKDNYGAIAGRNHCPIRKPDPLTFVLTEQLVPDNPIRRLVLSPVGMDLLSDFRRQSVS